MGWASRWVFEDAFLNFRIVDQIRAGNGTGVQHRPTGRDRDEHRCGSGSCSCSGRCCRSWGSRAPPSSSASRSPGRRVVGPAWRGARLWSRAERPRRVLVPFGALVYVVLPASWDWATSGLENGLTHRLARRVDARAGHPTAADEPGAGAGRAGRDRLARRVGVLSVSGRSCGPTWPSSASWCSRRSVWLVRPRGRQLVALVGGFIALPVLYEIFRVGYYGTLVPNTALAKNASSVLLVRRLELPARLRRCRTGCSCRSWSSSRVRSCVPARRRRARAGRPVLALPAGGLVHAAISRRSGGDYLHAPALPAEPLRAPRAGRWRCRGADGCWSCRSRCVGVWAVVTVGWLRIEHAPEPGAESRGYDIADGRRAHGGLAKPGHRPILATDFAADRRLLARSSRPRARGRS